MSTTITKTVLTALLALATVAPSLPATAQEAMMLEAHGFVRMVQPDQPRPIQVQPQQSPRADERQHASAD